MFNRTMNMNQNGNSLRRGKRKRVEEQECEDNSLREIDINDPFSDNFSFTPEKGSEDEMEDESTFLEKRRRVSNRPQLDFLPEPLPGCSEEFPSILGKRTYEEFTDPEETSQIIYPWEEDVSGLGGPQKSRRRLKSPTAFGGDVSYDADNDVEFKDSVSNSNWGNQPNILKINGLFDRYAATGNKIGCRGLNQLRRDLGIFEWHSFKFYCLMFVLNAQSKYYITRTEWIFPLFELGIEDLDGLNTFLEQMTGKAYGGWAFDSIKKFFTFVFKFLLDSPRSRTVQIDTALGALKAIMGERSQFLRSFSEFAKKKCRLMNLDQFKLFYDFSKDTRTDFANYDEKDCWPTMYDEFFQWSKKTSLMDTSEDTKVSFNSNENDDSFETDGDGDVTFMD